MKRAVWGAVAGGIGAAATGLAVGAAARKRSQIAAERRGLAAQLAAGPFDPADALPGEQSSITADDGVRLSCEEIEPSGGRRAALTVVLVHGFALDRRTWQFQRRGLAELPDPAVRQVLYDQRSHGRSERAPRESCTIEQLGHDLDAVIRTLAPEGPLVLVGHSMGGMTIMALAEQRPDLFAERVAGVALFATSAGEVGSAGLSGSLLSRNNPLTRGVGLLARMQPRLVEGVRRAAGDLIWAITRSFAYGDRAIDPALVDLVDSMISANAVDALTDFVDSVGSHDRIAALPALSSCEVLVVAGDADRVIPVTHSERIAAELPHTDPADAPRGGAPPDARAARRRGRGPGRPAGALRGAPARPRAAPAAEAGLTAMFDTDLELPAPADTEALGERLAAGLGAGDLVVLSGPLGAGKTVFVRGLARGLGVAGPVTSPTFVIAREHRPLPGGSGVAARARRRVPPGHRRAGRRRRARRPGPRHRPGRRRRGRRVG